MVVLGNRSGLFGTRELTFPTCHRVRLTGRAGDSSNNVRVLRSLRVYNCKQLEVALGQNKDFEKVAANLR